MPFRANKFSYLGRVWWAGVRANVIRDMAFRSNFLFGIARQMLWFGLFIFFIDVVFQNTDSVAGWSQNDMLIILALSRLIEGMMQALFLQNIMNLPPVVRNGAFDFYLTKPIPVMFYTAFRNFSVHSIGNIIAGIALLVYAIAALPTIPPLSTLALAAIIALCGMTVYFSLLIIVGSLVFYLERLEALWGFNVLFSEPLTVPFDIFPRGPRIALTYLLPVAFVVFVPAQALTGRLAWWQAPLAMALTILFLLLANLTWRAGLRRYSSASS